MRRSTGMMDRDLALLFGVETKYLNRQVKRNIKRFPAEFMMQLRPDEKEELVTNWHRFSSLKHTSRMPFAFTEHGVAMVSTILNSEQAIQTSIQIIKAFIRLRTWIAGQVKVEERLTMLENKVDQQYALIVQAIDALTIEKSQPVNPIGYKIQK